MATILSISIADAVFSEIEKRRDSNISRSEFVEELIREGLKKKGGTNEDQTE